MDVRLLTNYGQVNPFLDQVRLAADKHREALGFLPAQVYEENAIQGKLWVAISTQDRIYAGHLLYGGSYPTLRVIQVFVEPAYRTGGVGSRLIRELVRFGEEHGYSIVKARVAADLDANAFWERLGFHCVKRVAGGRTTNRVINIRVKDLNVPRLFELPKQNPESICEGIPEFRSLSYVLDVNVVIDLGKRRERSEAVGALVRAGFNHHLRVLVTDEAQRELERYHSAEGGENPVLEVIRQVPVLPSVDRSLLKPLMDNLRARIFPRRSRQRQGAERDESDLVHLATCIHHRITGFVTSENAILRASQEIKNEYGLDIVGPYEFLESEEYEHQTASVKASLSDAEVEVGVVEDRELDAADQFLTRLTLSKKEIGAALNPGASGNPRVRYGLRVDGNLVGIVSWDMPSRLREGIDLFCYIDESSLTSEAALDHIFEIVARQRVTREPYIIRLRHGADQPLTRRVARERGFGSDKSIGDSSVLVKILVPGIICNRSWRKFASDFSKLTGGLGLDSPMLLFENVKSNGLTVWRNGRASSIDFFEFERMISPGIVLSPGRDGFIIPIQERFAEELLGDVTKQLTFLPAKEARLRGEKAYFRLPRDFRKFLKGMLVLFYVSGQRKEVVGLARFTSTGVFPVDEIGERYSRQGVLSRRELEDRSDKNGRVHVITFSSFLPFSRRIGYNELKEMDCVGPANLVTAEFLEYTKLEKVLRGGELTWQMF